MASETSSVIPIGPVDVAALVEWITVIPFEAWPQQKRWLGELRPAMVNDLSWFGFADRVRWTVVDVIAALGLPGVKEASNYMLSVVMPGHMIERHRDAQQPGWLCRVHVPLTTNENAWFYTEVDAATGEDEAHQMAVGQAYRVDVTVPHWIANAGSTPRIHFMFDVFGQA